MKGNKVMKTIRYILTVVALVLCMTIQGQPVADAPQMEWQSTGVMAGSGSNLPMAAQNGVTTTYGTESTNRHNASGGPRRVGKDDDIGDPGALPIGDGVWILLICAMCYAVYANKKRVSKRLLSLLIIGACAHTMFAEGYESMTNIKNQTYEWDDVTNYTGDNGMAWRAVGAQDSKVGGYKALAIHSSVANNGLSGNLTSQQTVEGVGTVSFMVKGAQAGTGYGNRTFRVTAGSKSVDVTVNIPSMTSSYKFDAKVDVTGASTLAITMLESVSGETAAFYIYNLTWTSFSGKTDTPAFSCNDQFIANGTDTTYYTENTITVHLSSTTAGATLYYTTDGSKPTLSSTQSDNLTLGAGTHTVKAMAWTEAQGESEVATKIFQVAAGKMTQYNASDTNAEGTYTTTSSSALNKYQTLSGLPFYQLNQEKNHIITDAVVQPQGLSFYAKNTNNRTLTIAWQAGNAVLENGNELFEATTEWSDIQTISDFSGTNMKRFEVLLPAAAKGEEVRFRISASGTSVYVDDIITIGEAIERAMNPILSHAGGELPNGTEVTITPAAGTMVYYRINNGAEQTSSEAISITITENTLLEAYAAQNNKARSFIIRAQYTISDSTVGIDNTDAETNAQKILRDGKILIVRNGKMYDLNGREL